MNKHLTTQQFLLHKLVIHTTRKNLIVNMFKERRQISSRNIQSIGSLEQAKLTWGDIDHMVAWGDEAVALTQKGTKWDGNECSVSSCGWWLRQNPPAAHLRLVSFLYAKLYSKKESSNK